MKLNITLALNMQMYVLDLPNIVFRFIVFICTLLSGIYWRGH